MNEFEVPLKRNCPPMKRAIHFGFQLSRTTARAARQKRKLSYSHNYCKTASCSAALKPETLAPHHVVAKGPLGRIRVIAIDGWFLS